MNPTGVRPVLVASVLGTSILIILALVHTGTTRGLATPLIDVASVTNRGLPRTTVVTECLWCLAPLAAYFLVGFHSAVMHVREQTAGGTKAVLGSAISAVVACIASGIAETGIVLFLMTDRLSHDSLGLSAELARSAFPMFIGGAAINSALSMCLGIPLAALLGASGGALVLVPKSRTRTTEQ